MDVYESSEPRIANRNAEFNMWLVTVVQIDRVCPCKHRPEASPILVRFIPLGELCHPDLKGFEAQLGEFVCNRWVAHHVKAFRNVWESQDFRSLADSSQRGQLDRSENVAGRGYQPADTTTARIEIGRLRAAMKAAMRVQYTDRAVR